MALMLSADEVLTTTRSVRKRLDLTRPVPRSLISECMEIAFQAPNGRNLSSWQWVVIDDPKVMEEAGRIYQGALADFGASAQGQAYREAARGPAVRPPQAPLPQQRPSAGIGWRRRPANMGVRRQWPASATRLFSIALAFKK